MAKNWTPRPDQPSPDLSTGLVGWLRANLFSSPGNTLLTLAGAWLLYLAVPPLVSWGIVDAKWVGESRQACDFLSQAGSTGACWVFIKVRMGMFMYGFYPELERWRLNLTFLVLIFMVIPILVPHRFATRGRQTLWGGVGGVGALAWFGPVGGIVVAVFNLLPLALERLSCSQLVSNSTETVPAMIGRVALALGVGGMGLVLARILNGADVGMYIALSLTGVMLLLLFVRRLHSPSWRWALLFTLFPSFAFIMLAGGAFGLVHVETHYWGGLFLTLVVAGSGMATALPIGMLLALGRRSQLPVIKTVCVSFIEFVRGVPLVSVLFMASVMFPLFLPEGVSFDKLLRALVGVSFFYAAYMAEVIRGGLQAIPSGQYEAAKALGWTYWKMMGVIIMPQTLRLIIPGLAVNFLSLLKDTTLVAVIGLLDLLGIAKAAMADAEWLGFTKEAYVFAGIVFWIFCFSISRYSVSLEKKYHTNFQ